jgi:hypothetical protein
MYNLGGKDTNQKPNSKSQIPNHKPQTSALQCLEFGA